MNVDRYLRMIAGAFVLLSLALGHWVNPYWYLFTAFVGLNLFQSVTETPKNRESDRVH